MNESELRAGDTAEMRFDAFPEFVATGKIRPDDQGCCLLLGPWPIVTEGKSTLRSDQRLTVTKMAPRPVYVNHSREEPVDGDIVRDAVSDSRTTYIWSSGGWWAAARGSFIPVADGPGKMFLLVDGDTGRPPE